MKAEVGVSTNQERVLLSGSDLLLSVAPFYSCHKFYNCCNTFAMKLSVPEPWLRCLGHSHKCHSHYVPWCDSVALNLLIAVFKENSKKQRLRRRRAKHTPWSDSETLSRLLSSAELVLVFRISLVCPLPVSPYLQNGGGPIKTTELNKHIRP